MARLMRGELRFLLEDREPHVGMALEEAIRGREADDPAAHDREVHAVFGHDDTNDGDEAGSTGPTAGNGSPAASPSATSAA